MTPLVLRSLPFLVFAAFLALAAGGFLLTGCQPKEQIVYVDSRVPTPTPPTGTASPGTGSGADRTAATGAGGAGRRGDGAVTGDPGPQDAPARVHAAAPAA